jgi:hypothetical protein
MCVAGAMPCLFVQATDPGPSWVSQLYGLALFGALLWVQWNERNVDGTAIFVLVAVLLGMVLVSRDSARYSLFFQPTCVMARHTLL